MKDLTKRSRLRLPQTAACPQTAQQTAVGNNGQKEPRQTEPEVDTVVAPKRAPKRRQALGRNRASPARLFKLNALLNDAQRNLIEQWGWGGMLKVMAKEMPASLSMWVLGCFDPIRSELAIPGRGSIPVNADSYTRVFGLRNEGRSVCYEMTTEAIAFFNVEYGIESGSAPDFTDWCRMIKDMNGASDMKFLRAYFAGVISCFISPSTFAPSPCVLPVPTQS
ncbi:uncharacterized protein [Lolium perenne]|uniref:uncharacterized protein n=1 Tax=Lolium perenne TaxID=4522 RepID=UPI003A9A641B